MWVLFESWFEQTTVKDILGGNQKNLNTDWILDDIKKLLLTFKKCNMVLWFKKKVAYILEVHSEILWMK